jgi:hypothetical protein
MTDIFEEWKNNRFIVVPDSLTTNDEHLIILTDIAFWNDNSETLDLWCNENNCKIQGMVVVTGNAVAITAFCLRWL